MSIRPLSPLGLPSRLHVRRRVFPLGVAPLALVMCSVLTGGAIWYLDTAPDARRPDLVLVSSSPTHIAAYRDVIPAFERAHGVRVDLQTIGAQSLRSRIANALRAGTEVPDLIEVQASAFGAFTSGPPEDLGFLDLGPRLHRDGLDTDILPTRLALWTVHGQTLALPHDVHPWVMAYRRDLVAQLGIDVDALGTWDDFVAVGRKITADLDGDGTIDRFAIDLSSAPMGELPMLLSQQDHALFSTEGTPQVGYEVVARTLLWYTEQTAGPQRIATAAGWGQTYAKALIDGLVVFAPMPDWRTKQTEQDAPSLAGKLALAPLPAWTRAGRHAPAELGTGLAIARQTQKPELAWQLAKFLYLSRRDLGARFRATNIVPPVRSAWEDPAFAEPSPYYSGQAIGKLLASLAAEAPPLVLSPLDLAARTQLDTVYRRAVERVEAGVDTDAVLRAIRGDLLDADSALRRIQQRHALFATDEPKATRP